MYCCFCFSSIRRHTRLQGDWSSDVCSSDLSEIEAPLLPVLLGMEEAGILLDSGYLGAMSEELGAELFRSEERRVGKEGWEPACRCHLRQRYLARGSVASLSARDM